MTIRQHISLVLTALCLTCTVQAQPVFDSTAWNFGTIREADGRVSHTFTGKNRSDKPLVILDVTSSCGCTVPTFSRKPIAPGGTIRITVTFDPANRPGTFRKELDVFSSERRRIARLSIEGVVVAREKSLEELYPVDAGGGLRLSSTLCTFTYIYQGNRSQSSVGYVNTAKHPIRLDLHAQQTSGLVEVNYPQQIAPGERGEINLAYLIPTENPRYGTLRDVLEVRVDDRSRGTLLLAHGIGIDNPLNMPKETAPIAQITENIIKFGPVKRTAPLQRRRFTLTNTGGSELVVRAVENDGLVATTLAPGRRIAAGQAFTAEVMLNPAAQDFGLLSDHLVIITNDPARPMRRLRVTAIIEE